MMRSVLIGSVESSVSALSALYQQRSMTSVVAVAGLASSVAANVSGYCNLEELTRSNGTTYIEFETVRDEQLLDGIRAVEPDIVWAIGLSQLLGQELLQLPKIGCVGFHPTKLPTGRGRAPVAWSILRELPLAATFFLIDSDGVDSGPILSQIDVAVPDRSNSSEVIDLICGAIPEGIEVACKKLLENGKNGITQDEAAASYLGVRRDHDGVIDWFEDPSSIERLVKAAAPPYPGAWTFLKDKKVRIFDLTIERTKRWVAVPGRIVEIGADGSFVVATADGAVRVLHAQCDSEFVPRVGLQLGANPQAELFALRSRIAALEKNIARLSAIVERAAVDGDSQDRSDD